MMPQYKVIAVMEQFGFSGFKFRKLWDELILWLSFFHFRFTKIIFGRANRGEKTGIEILSRNLKTEASETSVIMKKEMSCWKMIKRQKVLCGRSATSDQLENPATKQLQEYIYNVTGDLAKLLTVPEQLDDSKSKLTFIQTSD